MTDSNRDQGALARLNRALVDDILAASDESILAEAKEEGSNPAALAAATRNLFEKAAIASRKTLLTAAKAAIAEDRRRAGAVLPLDAAAARRHLERLFKRHPDTAKKLTLAARKGTAGDFSDDEVRGLVEDFEDLGISLPEDDDPSAGR